MNNQVQQSLEASLLFIEMNIDILRTALSKPLTLGDEALRNEKANLIILKTVELFESITILLEDLEQPLEGDLKEIAKQSYLSLKSSLDSYTSISDIKIKEKFEVIRETLRTIEKGHLERRHSKDKAGTNGPTGDDGTNRPTPPQPSPPKDDTCAVVICDINDDDNDD